MIKLTPALCALAFVCTTWSCNNAGKTEETTTEETTTATASQEAVAEETNVESSEEVVTDPMGWNKSAYTFAFECLLKDPKGAKYSMTSMESGDGGTLTFRYILKNSDFLSHFTEESPLDLNKALKDMTGVVPFTRLDVGYNDPRTEEDFNHINPVFISWVAQNFDLQPQDMLGEQSAQQAYDKYMKRACRVFMASHDYLAKTGWAAAEAGYKQKNTESIAAKDGDILMNYLFETYTEPMTKGITPSLDMFSVGEVFHPGIAAGVWLRRRMDGSEAALWSLLEDVMKRFDPSFEAERASYKYEFDESYHMEHMMGS